MSASLRSCLIGALGIMFGIPTVALANSTTWTASGNDSDGNVDASAVITVSGGEITVVLTSLEDDAVAAGQLLSGIVITLNTTSLGSNAASFSSVTGNLVTIDSNGTSTSDGAMTLSNTHWGTGNTSSTICLETVSGLSGESCALGGQPNDLIIGSVGSNPNSSIDKNHMPSVLSSATFVIDVTGLSGSATVTGAEFGFGTGPDLSLSGKLESRGRARAFRVPLRAQAFRV